MPYSLEALFAHSPGNCEDFWGIPIWRRREHDEVWVEAHRLARSSATLDYLGWLSLSDAQALYDFWEYPSQQSYRWSGLQDTLIRNEYLPELIAHLESWQTRTSHTPPHPAYLRLHSILSRCYESQQDLLSESP